MKANDFKKQYNEGKTLGDMYNSIEALTGEQLLEIKKALEITNDYFGLTMREELYLSAIKSTIEIRVKYSSQYEKVMRC